MKIGIVGVGIVGSTLQYGFEKLGHEVFVHDIKLDTRLEDVLDTEICYICVPTPRDESGQCDTRIVEKVIADLIAIEYRQIIAIKSTVFPGTTERLISKWGPMLGSLRYQYICFVPEFLRERCAVTDFTENHDLCVIGTENKNVFDKVVRSHGDYPKKFVQTTPTEAELVKYFNNAYNATLITFANSFYEICKYLGVDYKKVKAAAVERDHIFDRYLDCNESFRGFGGMCLPKDLEALVHLSLDTKVEFFSHILRENGKYETTVLEGMRS